MGGLTVDAIDKAIKAAQEGRTPDNIVTIDGRDYYVMDRDALRAFVAASAPFAALGEATMSGTHGGKGKPKPKPRPKPKPTGY